LTKSVRQAKQLDRDHQCGSTQHGGASGVEIQVEPIGVHGAADVVFALVLGAVRVSLLPG
jgi:hypothetical protein